MAVLNDKCKICFKYIFLVYELLWQIAFVLTEETGKIKKNKWEKNDTEEFIIYVKLYKVTNVSMY